MSRNLDVLFVAPGKETDEVSHSVVSLVRQWAEKEVIGRRLEYRQGYERLFDEKRRTLLLTMGLQRLAVPEGHGGFGWQSPDRMKHVTDVLCEVGRADCSTGVLLAMSYALFSVVDRFSKEEAGLIGPLASSYLEDEMKTAACVLTGPGHTGVDTPLFKGRSILAEVEMTAGGTAVSGKDLRPLAAGLMADLFLVVCADTEGRPCLALVPGKAAGVRLGEPVKTTGLNALANGDIIFDKAAIPHENLIRGVDAVSYLFACLNLMLGSVSLGAGMNFFEILSAWSESRTIKGSDMLRENPLCASVLADTAEEVSCANLLVHDLAGIMSLATKPGTPGMERVYTYSAMIGARVQKGILRAINRGMELMGSAGYAKEWHAEKHWRDVKTIQSILSGVAAEAPVKMDTARFFYDCREI